MPPRIYVTTDLEGASGVVQEAQSFADAGRYEGARRSLTHDVNAVVVGAQAAGAERVVVLDGHGHYGGYNFLYEELAPGALYQLGGSATRFLEGLDESYSALFAVAYHAKAGTRAAVLDHTQSSRAIVNMWLNDQRVGELGHSAYFAGHLGVPLAMVSGDDKTCDEARELMGERVVTACVKYACKRGAALCLAPEDARRLLREKAEEAVAAAPSIAPLRLPDGPCELRVEYLRSEMAEGYWARTDVEMPNARTVIFRRDNAFDALNALCGWHYPPLR